MTEFTEDAGGLRSGSLSAQQASADAADLRAGIDDRRRGEIPTPTPVPCLRHGNRHTPAMTTAWGRPPGADDA
jgi:hypothetical protein